MWKLNWGKVEEISRRQRPKPETETEASDSAPKEATIIFGTETHYGQCQCMTSDHKYTENRIEGIEVRSKTSKAWTFDVHHLMYD